LGCSLTASSMGKAKPKAAGKAKSAGGVTGGAVLAAALAVAAAVAVGLLFPWGAITAPVQQQVAQQKAEGRPRRQKPQRRPPPPPPTVPDAERCRTLAATGHCASMMDPTGEVQRQCPEACEAWRGLSQIQRECAGYAEGGECGRNPAYMLTTCAAECAAWEVRPPRGIRVRVVTITGRAS
jgi:hypothetical protein